MNKQPPPADYDDNPEWTDEDFARARPMTDFPELAAVLPLMVRSRGRPVLAPEVRKQKVNIRLSPDVLSALRASGAGWQTRADELLRSGLKLTQPG